MKNGKKRIFQKDLSKYLTKNKIIMTKKFYSIFLIFIFTAAANYTFAQCTVCKDWKADYTFTNDTFPNKTACFKLKEDKFMFCSGKNKNVIEIPFEYKESTKEKPVLTISDHFFLIKAMESWDKEKLGIGFEFTETGLGYKILEKGTGKIPEKGKNVSVHYKGYLENGKEFDNSFKRGKAISFPLGVGKVIKGWDEGIAMFPVGTKASLKIPAKLGYGEKGAGAVIPPNATIYFDIEIVNAE